MVDYQDRSNLGVFSRFFRQGVGRSLKGVFGSFRLVLNKDMIGSHQDRWHAGVKQAHPDSLKIAVSNIQSVDDSVVAGGWDMMILKGLTEMHIEWELKNYPEAGRFIKVGHLDKQWFEMQERVERSPITKCLKVPY